MPEVPRDHRCGTRIPCDLRVLVLVHPAVFGPGVLLNVSISGALLQTPLVLTPRTQIELEIERPGMGRSSIMASITRREVQQYGVAFHGTNNTAIDRMLRLAHSQAEAVRMQRLASPRQFLSARLSLSNPLFTSGDLRTLVSRVFAGEKPKPPP